MQKLGETEKASDTNESGDGFKHVDVEMGEDEDQDQDMNSDEEDGEDCEPSLKGKMLFEKRALSVRSNNIKQVVLYSFSGFLSPAWDSRKASCPCMWRKSET